MSNCAGPKGRAGSITGWDVTHLHYQLRDKTMPLQRPCEAAVTQPNQRLHCKQQKYSDKQNVLENATGK